MFKWLADMIVKTPVQGTCSCCEGKKEQLRKMQAAILGQNESDFGEEKGVCSCGENCSGNGSGSLSENMPEAQGGIPFGARFSSAFYSASYHFDESSGRYSRAVQYQAADASGNEAERSDGREQHDDENQQRVGDVSQ